MRDKWRAFTWWRNRKGPGDEVLATGRIRFKYLHFKDLLGSNAELLGIVADLEQKLAGRTPCDLSGVRALSHRALSHAQRMIDCLNAIDAGKHPRLQAQLDSVRGRIEQCLDEQAPTPAPAPELVLPFARIDRGMSGWVGGKNANLGELVTGVGAPVPPGFAITTAAFHRLLAGDGLAARIRERLEGRDIDDPHGIEALSEEIQRLILNAPLPAELELAILGAYDALWPDGHGNTPPEASPRVAMRSSAVGEDGDLSFAGQHRSVLNVGRNRILQAYRYVVASLYTPRAIVYRHHKGLGQEDVAMAVACVQMVESVASGVVYTRNPLKPDDDTLTVSAVWGLGPYAVDGSISPDTYVVSRDPGRGLLEQRVVPKPVHLTADPAGGLVELPVAPGRQAAACLSATRIGELAAWAARIEDHYQGAQDIEWALSPDGRLVFLQTRPLRPVYPGEETPRRILPPLPGREVLLEGGAVACPGAACGTAFQVRTDADLALFPPGAILIARHSSPKFMVVLQKAGAVVTDAGSVTGHMASLCREFGVPALLDTKTATQVVPDGAQITVDAHCARIYRGVVTELAGLAENRRPSIENTPVHAALRRVAAHITPLNLLDPGAAGFSAERCASLHDIARFVHEHSYRAMFRMGEDLPGDGAGACRLAAPIPLDLHVIDLGGGLGERTGNAKTITLGQVSSAPFRALLDGLLEERLRRSPVRPVAFSGFLSVVQEQMLAPGGAAGGLGGRSYAIVSDKYLNFSARVGYHYSVLDCYCGQTVNKNYVTFMFKGGAADDVRRQRRARVIAEVLAAYDFTVTVTGDQVEARLPKYDSERTLARLRMLGGLLQFSRQMDMLMTADGQVAAAVRQFLDAGFGSGDPPPAPAA
jgi:pyruvate,water dikinase